MSDEPLHPEDAAAMRLVTTAGRGQGPLRQEISNAVVALYKQHFGRGPTDCRTSLEADLVIVVLRGGYTAAEDTMFAAGRWHDVRQARMAWQDSMEGRFVETIERLTQRTVRAFMSANRQDADLTVELFVLDNAERAG